MTSTSSAVLAEPSVSAISASRSLSVPIREGMSPPGFRFNLSRNRKSVSSLNFSLIETLKGLNLALADALGSHDGTGLIVDVAV